MRESGGVDQLFHRASSIIHEYRESVAQELASARDNESGIVMVDNHVKLSRSNEEEIAAGCVWTSECVCTRGVRQGSQGPRCPVR